jgi:hypothetical protein
MFLLSCVIVVLCVDPWFLYVPMINQDDKCLTLDKRLMITALCFRSVFDIIYVGKIIWEFIRHKKDLMSYFKFALIDILVILPIPEVRKTFLLPKLLSLIFFFLFLFFKFNYATSNSIIDSYMCVYIYYTMLSCLSIRYVDSFISISHSKRALGY